MSKNLWISCCGGDFHGRCNLRPNPNPYPKPNPNHNWTRGPSPGPLEDIHRGFDGILASRGVQGLVGHGPQREEESIERPRGRMLRGQRICEADEA